MSQKITIACEICQRKNYRLQKTQSTRLVIKKFCKHCNSHTLHKEEK